ncbi:hypothetical protein MRX96_020248 [Rhipicephalus microplus]
MDAGQLIDILRATIDPNQRETAEKQLEQVHKIIGFAPSLLQVVMTASLDMPVRQAGAIYLKNLVVQIEPWCEMRSSDAMVHAPELIRVQLSSCLGCVLKYDFPGRWTGAVDKVSIYLQSPESAGWAGALLALYTLVKNYEYKKPEEREPLHEAMQLLLPLLQQRLAQLLADQSEASVLLQKQILKIYFALVQYHFPLGLISREVCTQWMELLRVILDRPVPDVANQVDEDERPELPWWKCKKWAFHIVTRIFERKHRELRNTVIETSTVLLTRYRLLRASSVDDFLNPQLQLSADDFSNPLPRSSLDNFSDPLPRSSVYDFPDLRP